MRMLLPCVSCNNQLMKASVCVLTKIDRKKGFHLHTHKHTHIQKECGCCCCCLRIHINTYGLNWRYLPFMSLEPNCVLKNLLKKLFEFCANDNNKIMRHSPYVACRGAKRMDETEKKRPNGDRTVYCLFFHLDGRSAHKQIH